MVKEFLIKNGLHESCYDFDEHMKNFISEMEKGLYGEGSSLRMLPSYLGVIPEKAPSGDVIAIDAGGTNLRIALVNFPAGGTPVVNRLEKHRIPGSQSEISKNDFFKSIADYIGDRTEISDKVGFCFSFPCTILPDREGKIIHFDKEVRVTDSEGAMIRAELNAAFAGSGKPPVNVTVLNDTAAALIGSVFSRGIKDMGGYIGLIYGTGINICYYDSEKHMLINTEAGGYNGFEKSVCDAEIDAESEAPGAQCYEKMASGAYFSKVVLKAAKLAAAQGLFSEKTGGLINELTFINAPDIDAFLKENGSRDTELGKLCDNESDKEVLFGILDGLYDRAAKLTAIAMTAVLIRSGATADHPAFLVAEGSTFRKGFRLQERFENWIAHYSKEGKVYELMLADDHTVIGAAASVFL